MAYLSIRAGSSSLAKKQAMKRLGKAHVVAKVKWNQRAPLVRGKRLYSVRIHFRVKRPKRKPVVPGRLRLMPRTVRRGRRVPLRRGQDIATNVRRDLSSIEKNIRKVMV